jgi:HEAT repeat protein
MSRDAAATWSGAESPEWSTSPSATATSESFRARVIWSRPCEEMFEYLAENEPEKLLAELASGALPPSALTFAAEWAGRIRTQDAAPILIGLLAHPSPLVREGAVYGLEHLVEQRGVLSALRAHSTEAGERSPGVRAAAREVLMSL